MMSKNLRSVQTSVKRLMASAAPKAAASAGSSGEVKVSTLPSGLILATVDAEAPMARVAVTVRAGARYEPETALGLTHTLRSAAGFTTQKFTNFGITRNIEYYGGRLSVIGARDTITYLLEAHNDASLLDNNFAMLADSLSNPEFKHWELADNLERMKAELAIVDDSPHIQLAEALHKAAYKGGLRKSLYTPRHMLGKHSTEALLDYCKKRFVGPNTVVVGYGVEHQQLVEMVGKGLVLGSSASYKCNAQYIGGEIHLDSNSPLTYVALACESTGLNKPKDVLAASLFQTILGVGGQTGRLSKAVSSGTNVAVSAFNLNYEETGLLGVNLIAPSNQDVVALVKSAVKEFRAVANSVSDAELAQAKQNLKTSVMIGLDKPDALTTEIGAQLLMQGGKNMSVNELCKLIDTITAADVKAVAGKAVKGKPALATLGRNAPYLVDIME